MVYRQTINLPQKKWATIAEIMMTLIWWWILFHCFTEPGHIFVSFPIPTNSKFFSIPYFYRVNILGKIRTITQMKNWVSQKKNKNSYRVVFSVQIKKQKTLLRSAFFSKNHKVGTAVLLLIQFWIHDKSS